MTSFWRLLPALAFLAAVAAVIVTVEGGGPHVAINLLPVLLTGVLLVLALAKAGWQWRRPQWRYLLGAFGFAVPAIGLSLYLHLGLALDWGGMASRARTPDLLFRFLPWYTTGAGAIGFAIGWIIGRNIDQE
jgi:hypothetical protein